MGRDCLRCAPAVCLRAISGLWPSVRCARLELRSSSLWWFQVCLRQVADGEGLVAGGNLSDGSNPRVQIPVRKTDGEGFEPSVHCCTHAFQACAIDHSATHPKGGRSKHPKTLRGKPPRGGQRGLASRSSAMSSPVERTAMKRSAWKNSSMNVFMRPSRTQGVGHPRGDTRKNVPTGNRTQI